MEKMPFPEFHSLVLAHNSFLTNNAVKTQDTKDAINK